MTGGDQDDPTDDADPAADEPRTPRTAVAEPVVIDLRDGVDTIAAYEADQARRAEATRDDPA